MADNRTEGGSPTADAYKKYGNARGAFPIFDRKSALAAIHLRGRAKNAAERKNILTRAAKYAPSQAHDAFMADKKSGAI